MDIKTQAPVMWPPAPAAHPAADQIQPSDLVRRAVHRLEGEGWTVRATCTDAAASWHVAAQRGSKWRVVLILAPGSGGRDRQASRARLGDAVRLAGALGSMELWPAHVQPGGRLTFGCDMLSRTAWGTMGDNDADHLRARLGIAAEIAAEPSGGAAAPALAESPRWDATT